MNLELLERKITIRYPSINGIIISRNGNVSLERYYRGHKPTAVWHTASVAKSFTSALIGIAINSGHITSVDQKILDFFPEYKTASGDFVKRSLTIRHLLTMTAPTTLKSSQAGNEALDKLRRQPNWAPFILDQLGKGGIPGKFYYSSSNAHLLSAIISKATGLNAREYANKYLFGPIGITKAPVRDMGEFTMDKVFGRDAPGWANDPQGITIGGWGLSLTLKDLARFGSLYLNGGRWKNKQIIPAEWINESVKPNANNYGYLWWTSQKDGLSAFAALGSGGNAIFCLPELNLLAAITSKITRRAPGPWKLLWEEIIPVIEK